MMTTQMLVPATVTPATVTPATVTPAIAADLSNARPRTLLDAFADFLMIDVANGDATPDTIKAYCREVRHFVTWCQRSGFDPAHAERRDIERYREWLKVRGLSNSTRQHKLSIVRRFYEAAVKHDLIQANPAARVRAGKDLTPPEEKIRALTVGGLAALLAQIPPTSIIGLRDRTIVGLMAIHGLRRVEVHRLNHDNLELFGDLAVLIVHGKANKQRKIFLRPDTQRAIRQYGAAKLSAGLPLSGSFFVVHGNHRRGCRLGRRALDRVVTRYLEAASLKRAGVACHALRHTFGTLSVAGGAEIIEVQAAMGHASVETTSIYVKAVNRIKKNPANFIDVEL